MPNWARSTRVRCSWWENPHRVATSAYRHGARPQQPAGRLRPQPHQETVRCLPGARLELAAELADRQRHGGGQVRQRDGLGQARLHHVARDRELARGKARPVAGPAKRRPHGVIARELGREQHGQVIDIGPRGGFPGAQHAVEAEDELLDERVVTPELLRQLHPALAARRFLHGLVGQVDVHGLQVTAEFDGQVTGRRVQEQPAGRYAPRAAEPAVPPPHRDRSVQVQYQLMRPGRAEARPVRQFRLRGHVQPLPAQAGTCPHRVDPGQAQDAIGVR